MSLETEPEASGAGYSARRIRQLCHRAGARWVCVLLLPMALGAWAAAEALAKETPRDATRLEVAERFCFRTESCLRAVRLDIEAGRPIQWVIYTLGQAIYNGNPANAERAYESITRALTFAYDFLSNAELNAGQTNYAGKQAGILREAMLRYATVCDNRTSWLSKYNCITRRIFPLLPGRYNPILIPLEQMPNP